MMLVHWGNTNSKHNHSTTAYWADNWDTISSSRRGKHPCFDPQKDLVLPSWKIPNVDSISKKLWATYASDLKHSHHLVLLLYFFAQVNKIVSLRMFAFRPREKRKTLFFFNGNLGPAYQNGRPEAS